MTEGLGAGGAPAQVTNSLSATSEEHSRAEPEQRAADPPDWFVPFFTEYYRDLVATAMSVSSFDRADAEDVVCEVLKRRLESGEWDRIKEPVRYFRRAVINQVRTLHRRRNGKVRELPTDQIDINDPAAIREQNAWEDEQWATQLVDTLPNAQREVMHLARRSLSTREIAELLGSTEANVRSNLRHARAKLAAQVPPQTHQAERPHKAKNQQNSTPTGEEEQL